MPTLASPANNTTVTRSDGLTVTWTGGDPAGNVQILVNSALNNSFNAGGTATCIAPAGAGTFTIPPYVLLALPAGNLAGIVLAPADTGVPFTAPGLSLGLLSTHNDGAGYGLGAGTGGFTLR